ncbi:MAG: porin OmpA [Arsenophonus sp. ET-KM2-MAG3]
MKKITIAAIVTALITETQAAPKDNTWYTGIKFGLSDFKDISFYPYDKNIENSKAKRNQLGAGFYIGHQHNKYFSFELGYDKFGKIKYVNNKNNGILKSMGIQLTARLNYPVIDKLDLYARLGSIVWRTNTKVNISNKNFYKEHDTDISPIYSMGLEYTITPEFVTRLDYQWVSHIGNKDLLYVRPDNGMLSIGIIYRFNKSTAPIILPTPIPAPIENKRFTLRSDVLFEFNKHTLKLKGKTELDNLYSKLINFEPIEGHVMIFGYTDRIGSTFYNKPLSQKRTDEVMNYLIFKGIPAKAISSQSYGKENPVTGNTCNNIKHRNILINCLRPDRRVEVEIQGTTTEVIS